MLLESGQWLGKGSLLAEGQSRARPIECDLLVRREEGAIDLSGQWSEPGGAAHAFSARAVINEAGTYTVGMRLEADRLQGAAKLDSPPNAGLLWNDAGILYTSFALFAIAGGYGFRGFLRDGRNLYTWEIAFRLKQEVARGPNVISLQRRRPPG
jgi:hypothetical protein